MVQAYFSVIMATRNRPAEFRKAVDSVLVQSFRDIEIIIVNDGSEERYQAEYAAILDAINGIPVRVVSLARLSSGHGQSFAINSGVSKSEAPYICFLDDDDYWTDPRHLERAASVISSSPVDLYMANQAAYRGADIQPGPIWLDDLGSILQRLDRRPERDGSYTVDAEDLLRSRGFCHLNTLIVRRTLYEDIGGMAEDIRWECDHDLYLRLVDRAALMKFVPVVVSRHNIPDPTKRSSMTTGLTEAERRLFQLSVFRRAQVLARNPMIRSYAQKHTAYTLKRIAESLAEAERYVDAASYAREALRAGPTLKWTGYTAWLTFRALLEGVSGRVTDGGFRDPK
jgi:glycosyltransferase involved in cell wall biosynthesis